MNQLYTIRLDENTLGQILDGLRCREESWRNTATYLRDGEVPDDSFICEECNGFEEAENLANKYQRIIEELERQRGIQSETTTHEQALYLHGKADGQDNIITRIEANWIQLSSLPKARVISELQKLTDLICDD